MCAQQERLGSPKSSSDGAQPVQHLLEQGQVGMVASVGWPVDDDQVLVGHVTDQDADDAERKLEVGGDLGDGQMSRQRAPMARCSTVSFGLCSPAEMVETSVSIAKWSG